MLKQMARVKGNGDVSSKLLGFFVTPVEKQMIEAAKPENQSMSNFLSSIVIPEVKRILIKKKYEKQSDQTSE